MSTSTLNESVLNEHDAELAKIAQRCIMAALDHSRAHKIILVDDNDQSGNPPTLEVPPQALRLFAEILGKMAQRQPFSVIPQKMLLSTQEAANILNVSRPFVVKQLEANRIEYIQVGRHRRIAFDKLIEYQNSMLREADEALQTLADQAQVLDMGY
ncbi:MAG: excisionase family DNA-binding protein [Sulfuriferula sp.]|nr:excisionase family DNA-binding protein [Sulfuriferula sp.]